MFVKTHFVDPQCLSVKVLCYKLFVSAGDNKFIYGIVQRKCKFYVYATFEYETNIPSSIRKYPECSYRAFTSPNVIFGKTEIELENYIHKINNKNNYGIKSHKNFDLIIIYFAE